VPVCTIVGLLNVMGLTDSHFKFFALEGGAMGSVLWGSIVEKIGFLEGM
jgi:hypothetical protein